MYKSNIETVESSIANKDDKVRPNLSFMLVIVLFGGIFMTSERFINVENDAKAYFIGVLLILFLLVCSITRRLFLLLYVNNTSLL